MLPAAVKIYNGNTANVMDCVSKKTMSWSKVLRCNAASRTAVNQKMKHTLTVKCCVQDMGHCMLYLPKDVWQLQKKIKKTTRSSQFTNTSYQECDHRNNTITTTVEQLYSNLPNTCHGTSDIHCMHQFHQPWNIQTVPFFWTPPPLPTATKNWSHKHRCQFK